MVAKPGKYNTLIKVITISMIFLVPQKTFVLLLLKDLLLMVDYQEPMFLKLKMVVKIGQESIHMVLIKEDQFYLLLCLVKLKYG